MKEKDCTVIICKNFCSFFKGGKEDIHCGGYQVLTDNLTCAELAYLSSTIDDAEALKKLIPPDDEVLFQTICERCDFRIDGCDYRENRSGPPCGGFILIRELSSH
jgi:hypothetical protein